MANAEKVRDIGVPSSLSEHAFSRVDQNDGKIRVGGTRRHIACILLMTRRVSDDEFPLVGGEETIGDIDCDPLFALRFQTVNEQREIDVVSGSSEFPGIAFQSLKRVVEQKLRIVEQPANQGGFTI